MTVAVLIGLVVVSTAALLITDHVRKERRHERKDEKALEYVNTFISTLYMVLLALVVVVQWQNVDEINSDVRAEASSLTALIQTADRMPQPEAGIVRTSALDYAKGVLDTEWPPAPGAADDSVAQDLNRGQAAVTQPVALSTSLGTIEDQAITEYQALAQARDDRIASSTSEAGPGMLTALGVLSLVTVLTPLALGLRADAVAFGGLAVATVLVCMSFWFVLDLHSLYHGPIHADSGPLEQFLSAPGSY